MIDVPVRNMLDAPREYNWKGRKGHKAHDYIGALTSYELCDDTIAELMVDLPPNSGVYRMLTELRNTNRLWWFFASMRLRKHDPRVCKLTVENAHLKPTQRVAVQKAHNHPRLAWWYERKVG